MHLKSRQVLHWFPRILALIGLFCVGVFASQVLTETGKSQQILQSLIPYLELIFLLIVVTVVAWRWSTIGGILFICFGYFSISFVSIQHIILIIFPLMLVGLLCLFEGVMGWQYDDIEQRDAI